jgi:hypothetical protein
MCGLSCVNLSTLWRVILQSEFLPFPASITTPQRFQSVSTFLFPNLSAAFSSGPLNPIVLQNKDALDLSGSARISKEEFSWTTECDPGYELVDRRAE